MTATRNATATAPDLEQPRALPPADLAEDLEATAETSALSRWEGLANQIAEASQRDEGMQFDYANKHDQKAARSWIAQLRKVKARIESARKEAKAVHLERGRAVDESAKTLTGAVECLIERHAEPIAALAAAEEARIASHQEILQRIRLLSEGLHIPPALAALPLATLMAEGTHSMARVETTEEARQALQLLEAIDPTQLEEFQDTAEIAIAEALPVMRDRLAAIERREAEAAELAALRAAASEREQEDRDRRIREEAAEAERRAAADREQRLLAEKAEAERQAAADRFLAEQRAAVAEQRALELEEMEKAREMDRARQLQEEEIRRQAELVRQEERAQQADRLRAALITQLATAAQEHRTTRSLAAAIVDGTLHPALAIDWSQVSA